MAKLNKSNIDFNYDSDLDLEVQSISNAKLMAKFKKIIRKKFKLKCYIYNIISYY